MPKPLLHIHSYTTDPEFVKRLDDEAYRRRMSKSELIREYILRCLAEDEQRWKDTELPSSFEHPRIGLASARSFGALEEKEGERE